MNRTEFLAALAWRLQDLSPEERDDAVVYYNEYLDEVGAEGEEAAIAELGGAEKVANIIRANCGAGPLPSALRQPLQPELTPDGPLFAKAPEAPATEPAFAAAQRAGQAAAAENDGAPTAPESQTATQGQPHQTSGGNTCGAQASTAYNAHNTRILWVLLIICTFPIWIGLVGGIFGVSVGLFGTLAAIVFSGVAMMISAGIAFAGGVVMLSTSVGSGFVTMGLALLTFALGTVMTAGCIWLLTKGVPLLFKFVGKVVQAITGKVGK